MCNSLKVNEVWSGLAGSLYWLVQNYSGTVSALKICHPLCSKILSFGAIRVGIEKTAKGVEYLVFLGETLERRWIIRALAQGAFLTEIAAFELTVRTAFQGYHIFTRTPTIGDKFDCWQEPDNDKAGYASSTASRREILRERLLRFGGLALLSLKTIDDGLSSRPGICSVSAFRNKLYRTFAQTRKIWSPLSQQKENKYSSDKDTNQQQALIVLFLAMFHSHFRRIFRALPVPDKY